MVKQDGTEWVMGPNGDEVEVPCYVPGPGQSVDKLAKELGVKVLGRRESRPGEYVCVIADSGIRFRCVKA